MGMAVRLTGILLILMAAIALSVDRRAIRPRIVITALSLQVSIAVLTLNLPAGQAIIESMANGVQGLMSYSRAGIDMLFGGLAAPTLGFSLAINMLPVIIFFAALASILNYLKIIPLLVRSIGGVFERLIGTGRVESLCAAANIFVGQSESPLVIRPYLQGLSPAALFTVMTSGMAGVAGTVLAAYAQLGVNLHYLLVASFMAAPGGLLMAKAVFPDVQGTDSPPVESPLDKNSHPTNLIMAATQGTQDGVRVAVSVGAMLISFVALVALANGLLRMIGHVFGIGGLTFQKMLGFVLSPAMYFLGIPWSETGRAGALFGERLILNEFVAFLDLMSPGSGLSPHSAAVMTFALCGFANIGSIGIQMAVIGSLAPEHRGFVSSQGPRALMAASLSNLMSAAIAGLLIPAD